MTISGAGKGLGWIDFKITAITINGSDHLPNPQEGEAPTEDIGYTVALSGIPMYATAENDEFSFTVVKASKWRSDPGPYEWTASGQALRKLARWDGGQWVVHNNISDPTYTHDASGSGSWKVEKKYVCSVCKRTDVSSPTAHHVPCPNSNCNAGRSYWKCYGVPASHALLATCSNCNATNVYACSGHPNSCTSSGSTPPTGSTPPAPTDNTPNCQDCTSDCSSPCSCTNSGTCGGTVSTPPSGSTPPSNTPEPPPAPEPKLVQCTKCNGTYDPNDASDKSRHTVLQPCLHWGCSVVFYVCSPELAGPCAPGYSAHSAD